MFRNLLARRVRAHLCCVWLRLRVRARTHTRIPCSPMARARLAEACACHYCYCGPREFRSQLHFARPCKRARLRLRSRVIARVDPLSRSSAFFVAQFVFRCRICTVCVHAYVSRIIRVAYWFLVSAISKVKINRQVASSVFKKWISF